MTRHREPERAPERAQHSPLDGLIEQARAQAAAHQANDDSAKAQLATEIAQAYRIVEDLLRDAISRVEPWTIIAPHKRRWDKNQGFIRATRPVDGWVFPFGSGAIAVTLGGRVLLFTYNEGNEKHGGSVSGFFGAYPPHLTWPGSRSAQEVGRDAKDVGRVMREGAGHFAPALAHALAFGHKWHTPIHGMNFFRGDDAAVVIARMAPSLEFPERQAKAL